MYKKAKINIENIITAGNEYLILGETETYFVIKNNLGKHELIKKYIFEP